MSIYSDSHNLGGTIFTDWVNAAAAEALFQRALVAPLVANYDASGARSKVYSIPVIGTFANPGAIGETADLTTVALSIPNSDVTLGEVGLMSVLTDIAGERSVLNGLADTVGRKAAEAVARKIDGDIAALFPALNGGTSVGTSGTGLKATDLLQGIFVLESNSVEGAKAAVLHPQQVHKLRLSMANATGWAVAMSTGGVLTPADPTGYCGNPFGVDVFASTLVGAHGTSSDKAGALMGLPAGPGDQGESPIALAIARAIRVELQRDASRRGWEVVVTSVYGVGEILDKAGVCVRSI